jgi:Preprotein translocase subunit SecD
MPKNIFINILIGAFIIIGSLLVVAFKPVNLGLDLKGGISMVLAPDIDKVIKEEYENTASDISKLFLKNHINVLDVTPSQDGIYIDLLNASDYSKVYELLTKYYKNRIDISKVSALKVKVRFSSIYLSQIKENVITQTLEVLRRRVDQLGVVQPVITRLGNSKVMVELPGVMDLERAKKVLGKTAQLELMEVVDASASLDALQKELKTR